MEGDQCCSIAEPCHPKFSVFVVVICGIFLAVGLMGVAIMRMRKFFKKKHKIRRLNKKKGIDVDSENQPNDSNSKIDGSEK